MVKIFADCASLDDIRKFADDPLIQGFTTNPAIMRKAGITDYWEFAKGVIPLAKGKHLSFEVLADTFEGMHSQATRIASWGPNVWVKVPVTNTLGQSTKALIGELSNLQLNITAVMTDEQIQHLMPVLRPHHIVSVFNGRRTDTQREPLLVDRVGPQYLWASTRHVGSLREAEEWGYDIITMTPDLIAKLSLFNRDLDEYSLDTVKQFFDAGKGIKF